MDINATSKMEFPDVSIWGQLFGRWYGSLVNGLSRKFSRADREDAVMQAFAKLMAKPKEGYGGHVPQTEGDWYGNIRWQAKAFLSRMADSRSAWKAHHKRATEEGYLTASVPGFNGLDIGIRNAALRRTLDELCFEAGIKEANVAAYVRRYLEGEASNAVAAAHGITRNNLHQIRHRIEKLLKNKGKKHFLAIRRRLFLEAA